MAVSNQTITQFINGDAKALSVLYDAYGGALYHVILKMCNDRNLANDILQESFITIWNNANSYNPKLGRFYTWAYRIVRNKTLNAMRSKNYLIQKDDISVYDNKESNEGNEAVNVNEELHGALNKLAEHHKKAIELVYFNGLTHREAHTEMGVPLGTFKSYIQQALRELKKYVPNELFVVLWLLL